MKDTKPLEAKVAQSNWLNGYQVVISQVLRAYGDGTFFPSTESFTNCQLYPSGFFGLIAVGGMLMLTGSYGDVPAIHPYLGKDEWQACDILICLTTITRKRLAMRAFYYIKILVIQKSL